MKKILYILFLLPAVLCSQSNKKDNTAEPIRIIGPMLGYVTFNEAHLWLQTEGAIIPMLQYWDVTKTDVKKLAKSTEVNTQQHIYKFICTTDPGKRYQYKVLYNLVQYKEDSLMFFNTPALWRYRAPAPDFRIAFGSCHYKNDSTSDRPGKGYGDSYNRIFNIISDKNPDMMLWLGDNVYLRDPDWTSETGIYKRYKAARSDVFLERLLRKCPNYAIWDDHDYGSNDANGSFAFKGITTQTFQDYWCNSPGGIPDFPGITSAFEFNDAQFFLLDNRYFRTIDPANPSYHTVLGEVQREWLKQSLLRAHDTDFKVICVGGQFLNTAAVFENFANWDAERTEILNWIRDNKIHNVIFLTGDRHFAELSTVCLGEGLTVYDFTTSPLTSGVGRPKATEKNENRVEGTLYTKDRNFGMLEFQGKGSQRQVHFVLYDKFGSEQWRHTYSREGNAGSK